jgi:hypothetical protein
MDKAMKTAQIAHNDAALLNTNIIPPPTGTPATNKQEGEPKQTAQKPEEQAKRLGMQRETDAKNTEKRNKVKLGHHFVVLPTGLGHVLGGGDKWEKVMIRGVEDEVAAHTGLFIRDRNLDYVELVERVGKRLLGWCEKL